MKKLFYLLILITAGLQGAEGVNLTALAKNAEFLAFFKGFEEAQGLKRTFDALLPQEQRFIAEIYQDWKNNPEPQGVTFLGRRVWGWSAEISTGATVIQPLLIRQKNNASCGYYTVYNAKTFLQATEDADQLDLLLPAGRGEIALGQGIMESLFSMDPIGEWRQFVIARDRNPAYRGEWIEAEQLEQLIGRFFPEVDGRFSLINGNGNLLTLKDLEYNFDQPAFIRHLREESRDNWYFLFVNNQTAEQQQVHGHGAAHWVVLAFKKDPLTGKRVYYLLDSMGLCFLYKPFIQDLILLIEATPVVRPRGLAAQAQAAEPTLSPLKLSEKPLPGVVQRVAMPVKEPVRPQAPAAAAVPVPAKKPAPAIRKPQPVVQIKPAPSPAVQAKPVRPAAQPAKQVKKPAKPANAGRAAVAQRQARIRQVQQEQARLRQQAAQIAEVERRAKGEQEELDAAIALSLAEQE